MIPGIGGLTILKALIPILNNVDYYYVADTAHMPYGNKSPEQITLLSTNMVTFLSNLDIHCCINACHTIAATAHNNLANLFNRIPFFELVSTTAQYAATQTKKGIIGIVGTNATIATHAHAQALKSINSSCTVIEQACPRLASAIEYHYDQPDYIRAIVQEYFLPLRTKGVDCIILACTHYPLVLDSIKEVIGNDIILVTGQETIASLVAVQAVSTEHYSILPTINFFVTDNSEEFAKKSSAIIPWPSTTITPITLT